MMDYEGARRTMVECQLRTSDVTDARVLDAMTLTPREPFVPPARRVLAYLDADIAVAPGRFLIEPAILAKMLQAVAPKPQDVVLDIGCATGYSSAVLARLAGGVVALEQDPALAEEAARLLQTDATSSVAVVQGPLEAGWPREAPFDVIMLQGSVETVPAALTAQLRDGGRLVAVEGRGRAARAMLYVRSGDDVSARMAFDAAIPPLPGFEAPKAFVF